MTIAAAVFITLLAMTGSGYGLYRYGHRIAFKKIYKQNYQEMFVNRAKYVPLNELEQLGDELLAKGFARQYPVFMFMEDELP